jgi:hypothetical protein
MIRVQTMRFGSPERLLFASGKLIRAERANRPICTLELSLSWQTEPLPMLESA